PIWVVATRGEIAVRVIRACRELGMPTVAVYSDCDRGARHVRDADQAVHIGPSPASESYLRIQRLIDAARATGADAVPPARTRFARGLDPPPRTARSARPAATRVSRSSGRRPTPSA